MTSTKKNQNMSPKEINEAILNTLFLMKEFFILNHISPSIACCSTIAFTIAQMMENGIPCEQTLKIIKDQWDLMESRLNDHLRDATK
jgi:hypothetical protein